MSASPTTVNTEPLKVKLASPFNESLSVNVAILSLTPLDTSTTVLNERTPLPLVCKTCPLVPSSVGSVYNWSVVIVVGALNPT